MTKCNLGDMKNFKLRSRENCERSHIKTKKTVMHCKHDQSQSVALSKYENLPEINLLQAQVPSQKFTRALRMRSPQPGCYGHMIGEIQLVCQTVLLLCSRKQLSVIKMFKLSCSWTFQALCVRFTFRFLAYFSQYIDTSQLFRS